MPRMHPHAAVIMFAATFCRITHRLAGQGPPNAIEAQGLAKRGREDEHLGRQTLCKLAEEQGYGRPQGFAAARARR